METVNSEVERFSRIWDKSKEVNPNGFNVLLTMFLSTVDTNIVSEVELRICDKYATK